MTIVPPISNEVFQPTNVIQLVRKENNVATPSVATKSSQAKLGQNSLMYFYIVMRSEVK